MWNHSQTTTNQKHVEIQFAFDETNENLDFEFSSIFAGRASVEKKIEYFIC